jgi:hypothetical protein
VEPLKNPQSSMELQIVAGGEFPAPRVVDNHRCAELGSLHDCLNLAAIPRALPSSLREEEIDSALFVTIATLKKSIGIKEEVQAIFGRPAFKELITHSFWHEHDRKEKTQLRQEIQLIESNDTLAVDRTAARVHSN